VNDLLASFDVPLIMRTLVGIGVILVVVTLIQRAAGVRLGAQPVIAMARAVLQLAIASAVLSGALSLPWTVIGVLVIMLSTASWTSGGRLRRQPGGGSGAQIAVVSGGVIGVGTVLALGMMPLSARNLVAIGGILIGASMTATTLTGRHFRTLAHHRSPEVQAWWALGATSPVAFAPVAQEAMRDALIPNLDQTRSTGIVTLPGAFIGALFGGASPVEAARFQVVVLSGILLAQTVASFVLTRRLSRMTVIPALE
jgi:putative ABC transport system permease protein